MDITYTTYPDFEPEDDQIVYYIEFLKTAEVESWTLFKRNLLLTNKQLNDRIAGWGHKASELEQSFLLMSREGDPWMLGSGSVTPNINIGVLNDANNDLNTKTFLKFMVDALNEKSLREKIEN